jgi:hypothetical protein
LVIGLALGETKLVVVGIAGGSYDLIEKAWDEK